MNPYFGKEYTTNFVFVEYEKVSLDKEARKFISRFYGSNALWSQNKSYYQIAGTKEDVNIFVDYLQNECGLRPNRTLFGEDAMLAMMES